MARRAREQMLGGVALLFGASGVFVELQASLNAIWEVRVRPGRGVKGSLMVWVRIVSDQDRPYSSTARASRGATSSKFAQCVRY